MPEAVRTRTAWLPSRQSGAIESTALNELSLTGSIFFRLMPG